VREFRDVYVPFNTNQNGMTNPAVKIEPPPDGVIIYRFEESFIYPNASYHNSALVDYVKANTKRGKEASATKLGDRPWNDPGPSRFSLRRGKKSEAAQQLENEANGVVREEKMTLRAVILDFGAVANLDTVRPAPFSFRFRSQAISCLMLMGLLLMVLACDRLVFRTSSIPERRSSDGPMLP
jgi:sodium-independent sulfate anion transporter 11